MAISKIKGSAIQDATITEEKLEDEAGSFRMILNASDGSATDAGDFLLLDATASSTNVGEQFLFEPATDDGSAVLSSTTLPASDSNLENFKLSETDKNSTIKSEGGDTTTNIAQGLCKGWALTDFAAAQNDDSFNVSAYTDYAAGYGQLSWNNDFSNAHYAVAQACSGSGTNPNAIPGSNGNSSKGTAAIRINTMDSSNDDPRADMIDYAEFGTVAMGDLA